ncbi:hypothetical protein ACRRTK_014452 [Alexandromys fortis]
MDFNQLEAFLTAQTKKQGGITGEQAAVISKFWKSHKTRIRESLLNQSRWDNGLRGLSWRVDGKSQSRHTAQIHTPAAIVELEFGKSGQHVSSPGVGLFQMAVCQADGVHERKPEAKPGGFLDTTFGFKSLAKRGVPSFVTMLHLACESEPLEMATKLVTVEMQTVQIQNKESEFLCLEFDEVKVKQVLKRLSEVEESIGTLMQAA